MSHRQFKMGSMDTNNRIERLERICRMQQALLDHQLHVINQLLSHADLGGGTQMLDDQDWHALTAEVRAL